MNSTANNTQTWAEQVAAANGTSADLVLQQWKGYVANCAAFDQSPTREEFVRWYRLEAGEQSPAERAVCMECGRPMNAHAATCSDADAPEVR